MERNDKGQFVRGEGDELFEGHSVYYDAKGYPCTFIDGQDVKVHVYVWERENGPKPEGYDIHHKDFDKSNYELDNLELLTKSDHQRLHAGWVRDGNGKWVKKPCKDCEKKLPLDRFYERKGLTPSHICKQCTAKRDKKRQQDKEYRDKRKRYMKKYYQQNKEKWKNYGS